MDRRSELEEKYNLLKQYFQKAGSAAVAFSGGVDSTFLLRAAHEALGEHVIAVTANLNSVPGKELSEAEDFCRKEGVRQFVRTIDELKIEGFSDNPRNRCYLCKKAIFREIMECAREQGASMVAEGSNMDDMGDYRPGLQAIAELGIASPLRECGFTKADIRELSRKLQLPTWEKPSFACLSSRFAYGEKITKEKLFMVEKAEELLWSHGFHQGRVRIHDRMARIELLPEEMGKIFLSGVREELTEKMLEYGFSYVTVDLKGYRSGSMNESFFKREE